jgi:3-hydroxyacyl-CoA dehydrogenase
LSRGKQIQTIGLVGAGTIGRSWAVLFAGKGIEVILQDIKESSLKLAKRTVAQSFRDLVKFGLLSEFAAESAIRRVSYTMSLEQAVSTVDYVQECVPESLQLKRKMFREISALTHRGIIIASSSGGFAMSKIQSAAEFPARCVVVHPCQIPVHMTRLVEIVPGKLTRESTMRTAVELMERVGKRPILLKHEVQDYVTNRLQFTMLREALAMVGKGIATAEDIDIALCEMARASTCVGLGPFMQTHLHGGPHGKGEIEAALQYYSKILPDTWRSLAKWSKPSKSVISNVQKSVRIYVRKRGMSSEQLIRWRDQQLLNVARTVWCD